MKWTMPDLLCDGCLGNGRAVFLPDVWHPGMRDEKIKGKRCADCSKFGCAHITGFKNDGMLRHAEVLENSRQVPTIGIMDWAKQEEERWQYPKCQWSIAWYDLACPKFGTNRSDRLFRLKTLNL